MTITRVTVSHVAELERAEWNLSPYHTVLTAADAGLRRAALDAIAVGTAIYGRPGLPGPTNGLTNGRVDEPAFEPPDPGRRLEPAVTMIETMAGSIWSRHREADGGTTETAIVRMCDQHPCALVRLDTHDPQALGEAIARACERWHEAAEEPHHGHVLALVDDIDRRIKAGTASATLADLHARFPKLQLIATAEAAPPGIDARRTIAVVRGNRR